MKRLQALLLLLPALALAGVHFVPVPLGGETPLSGDGRIVALEYAGSHDDTSVFSVVGRTWTTEASVAEFAFTNHTYSVVVTNGAWAVTNTAPRPYEALPPGAAAYWTNDVVRTWAETNWVPVLAACATNAVTGTDLPYYFRDGWSLLGDEGTGVWIEQ